MRIKLKISIFSKMARTILIKFCVLIAHSKPNNMILSVFPGKIFSFSSFNVGPKPTHQSRSNSIYRILLQIFLAIIFVFNLPLKLSVVHTRKNKIYIFSKMAPTKLIKFCGLTVHSKPNNVTLSAFPEKIPEIEKKNLTFVCASPNGAHNSTDQSHPISISRAPCKYLHYFFFILDLLLN